MSKTSLRLLVVILIVLVSVILATVLFFKPNNDAVLFSYWQSQESSSFYDVDTKIDAKFGGGTSFANKKLEEETNIEKIATISQGIDKYLENLLKVSSQSKNVDDNSLNEVKRLLKNYSNARVGKDGTGYWINYCYGYVRGANFNPDNTTDINVYNDIVSTVEKKWFIQAQAGAQLLEKLDSFVTKFCFGNQHTLDLKNVLLHFESTFASEFVNPSVLAENQTLKNYYLSFCNNHLNEYRTLATQVAQKLNASYLNYSENDLYLCNHYFTISATQLNSFIASGDKSAYIDALTNPIEKKVLQIIYTEYLGGH